MEVELWCFGLTRGSLKVVLIKFELNDWKDKEERVKANHKSIEWECYRDDKVHVGMLFFTIINYNIDFLKLNYVQAEPIVGFLFAASASKAW
jgi:hypothetical protein